MVAPGSTDQRIRYFVELLPREFGRPQATINNRTGVLLRNHLPGSIIRLYRYAGYEVTPPVYTLYISSMTLRWPYYVTAIQLTLAALIALLAAFLQHRHLRRIITLREFPPVDDRI
jgi:hypothetical protein